MAHLKLWLVVVSLVVAHLIFDFFVPGLISGQRNLEREIEFAILGVCFGQINLIASWATLAQGPIIARIPWAGCLAALMWNVFLLGNIAIEDRLAREEAVLLGWVLMGGVLIAQIPLWISSRVFRWRLVPPAQTANSVALDEKQFNLRHLLLGMFFISIALAISRFFLPPGDIWIPTAIGGELKVLLPIAAIWNVLTTVPCFWAAFARKEGMIVWFFSWFVYCGLLTGLEVFVLSLLMGMSPPNDAFTVIYALNLFQCWCVFGSLLIIRAAGFRFVRMNLHNSESPQTKNVD